MIFILNFNNQTNSLFFRGFGMFSSVNVAAGSVFVFQNLKGVFTQITEIFPPDAIYHGYFGASVSILGTSIAVGAPNAARKILLLCHFILYYLLYCDAQFISRNHQWRGTISWQGVCVHTYEHRKL